MYYYPMPVQWQQGFVPYGQPMWNPWQQPMQQPIQQPMQQTVRQPKPTVPNRKNTVTSRPVGKNTPKSKGNELRPEQFTAKDLSQEELDKIVGKYGVDIEDIYKLSPGQKWMFGRAQKVTGAFFLQMFFKVTMQLSPAAFHQKLDEVSLRRANLRTAFAYRGMKEPYQVVLKNRRPELRLINRSDKTMEELREELEDFRVSDRRRGFDLENDPLLRITIFSSAEKDTYAVIVSQPHINDDGASEMMMFKEIFLDYALGDKVPLPDLGVGSYRDYAKWLEGLDREEELGYWKDILSKAPETRLPGRIFTSLEPEMNTLTMTFSKEKYEDVTKLQGRYGATINSIAQAAWAVMLQKIYRTTDVVFGSITSGRSAEVQDNDKITGGFVNAFPVRIKTKEHETFAELTKRVQLQIVSSQNKAHFSPDELGERLGRKTAVFDHLLNFHNFAGASQKVVPNLPGFTILGADFFDNLSTGFCLYFQNHEGALHCLFNYDAHSFTERKIRLLMDCYQKVFRQVSADKDKTLTIENIECPDISSFLLAEQDDIAELERIQSFLRDLPLFDGINDEGILSLAKEAVVKHYAEGDEILRENGVPKGLDIVMEGFAESYRTARTGWTGSLQMLGVGKILSAAGALKDTPSYTGVGAVSDTVTILHLPKDAVYRFMQLYPKAALNLIKEQEELSRRLSFFWINADE